MGTKKYRLTDEFITIGGKKLYRIEALRDFGFDEMAFIAFDVKKGNKGGFIEKESNLSHESNAWVSDDARVYGDARINGNARVFHDASVYDRAWVSDEARVFGDAKVCGGANVTGMASISDRAQVSGNAKISVLAWISGQAKIFGEAKVYGNASVSGQAMVYGKAWVYDKAKIYDRARVFGEARISGRTEVLGEATISGNQKIKKGYYKNSARSGKYAVGGPVPHKTWGNPHLDVIFGCCEDVKTMAEGGATAGQWKYEVYDNGEWRKATQKDFKYWYNEFGSDVMDKFGKDYKKGQIPFSEVENVYNPQGYEIATKTRVTGGSMAGGGNPDSNRTQRFIEQTAKDYDMPVHEVERIDKLYPNNFYEKLEEYISERAKGSSMAKGGKLSSGKPLYTSQELLKKYKGKFIDTYPHHHTYWNDKIHQFETVYEVRGVSRTIKENFQTPEEVVN